jgi:phospholipase D1/2
VTDGHRERGRIIAPGRNAWKRPRADGCGLLVDAKDYYTAFYRAALQARRYILLSGWQFDRGVKLLRDQDLKYAAPVGGEVRLLKFLDHLCQTRPELEIYILAWDFHVVFALEREWMQKLYFHWATHERLRFRFDDCHPPGACHHQKFVVIDGTRSFLGGIDLCEARWDDRSHRLRNPSRLSRGRPQKPYHDVQGYFEGTEVAGALTELFRRRWKQSGGEAIRLPRAASTARPRYRPRGALPLPPGPVALSSTDPRRSGGRSTFEIRTLMEDAITSAEALIYLETQYFSSRRVCESLERRMRDRRRPPLEIVLILNQRAEALKEEIAVGLRQAQNIEKLRHLAEKTGHALGAYYTVADGRKRRGRQGEVRTYIHSKLTIVDDRFLSMGSANLTNRSMDFDTELNASWETRPGSNSALVRAIRRARVSLLAEHIGATGPASRRALGRTQGLVESLDGLTDRSRSRLRTLPPPTRAEARTLGLIDPRALPFDPEADGGDEDEAAQQRSLFRRGIRGLWDRVAVRSTAVD